METEMHPPENYRFLCLSFFNCGLFFLLFKLLLSVCNLTTLMCVGKKKKDFSYFQKPQREEEAFEERKQTWLMACGWVGGKYRYSIKEK